MELENDGEEKAHPVKQIKKKKNHHSIAHLKNGSDLESRGKMQKKNPMPTFQLWR